MCTNCIALFFLMKINILFQKEMIMNGFADSPLEVIDSGCANSIF